MSTGTNEKSGVGFRAARKLEEAIITVRESKTAEKFAKWEKSLKDKEKALKGKIFRKGLAATGVEKG